MTTNDPCGRVHAQNVAAMDIVLNFPLRNQSNIMLYYIYIIIKCVDIPLTNPGCALTFRQCCYFFFIFIVL